MRSWSASWIMPASRFTPTPITGKATVNAKDPEAARTAIRDEAIRTEFGLTNADTIKFFRQAVQVSRLRLA